VWKNTSLRAGAIYTICCVQLFFLRAFLWLLRLVIVGGVVGVVEDCGDSDGETGFSDCSAGSELPGGILMAAGGLGAVHIHDQVNNWERQVPHTR